MYKMEIGAEKTKLMTKQSQRHVRGEPGKNIVAISV